MKNTLKSILFGAALLSMASCNLLDITQDGQLSQSNMWQDVNDVKTSTTGIYYRMRSCFAADKINVFYWGDARIGSYIYGPSLHDKVADNDMVAIRNNTMNGGHASASWSSLYTAIDQSNYVLKYGASVPMSASDKGYCLGQAYFARAYLYFWAARLWGDVPLNLAPIESTTQPETYPTRTPKAEVYAQIGKDIESALENVQYLGNDKYMATADAVYMLKAEYALWMYSNQNGGDSYLALAEDALSHLDISAGHLNTNFAESFSRTNKLNQEVVFALSNSQSEKRLGGFYWVFYCGKSAVKAANQNNPVPINQTQWWSYSESFRDRLLAQEAAGDKRVATNMGHGDYYINGGQLYWINKYLGDMSSSPVINDCDLLYYRYALAIMLDAELKYYKKDYSGALKSLNIIAKRAYGVDSKYTSQLPADVRNAIFDEYCYEFPAEGVIWWAAIRLEKIWEVNEYLNSQKATNPNILLWPISNSARNKNHNLKQTEGWS